VPTSPVNGSAEALEKFWGPVPFIEDDKFVLVFGKVGEAYCGHLRWFGIPAQAAAGDEAGQSYAEAADRLARVEPSENDPSQAA